MRSVVQHATSTLQSHVPSLEQQDPDAHGALPWVVSALASCADVSLVRADDDGPGTLEAGHEQAACSATSSAVKAPDDKLRVTYECNPMAKTVVDAGGKAVTVQDRALFRALAVRPRELHQRVPVVLASPSTVDELVALFGA